MAKKIKIGIIGTGGIANAAHMPAYSAIPDECEIVALCDIDEKALKDTAAKYPHIKKDHLFSDYKKLLEMDEIDAVSVTTYNSAHMNPTVAAFEAGKHVICEKPVAKTAKEAQKMVDAAKKAGKIFQVGYMSRFVPENVKLKEFIDAGELGDIYYARAQAMRVRGIPGWGHFIDKEIQGGGPLIDIGVHMLDLTLWLMGHPKPIACSGITYAKFGHRDDVVGFMGQWDSKKFTVEDMASALIRFDNGATVVLEASFVANIRHELYVSTLLGTEGGGCTNPFSITQERHKSVFSFEPQIADHNANPYNLEIADFIKCIKEKKEPRVTGEQAMQVAKIMDAIYESSATNAEVKISQ